jgi:hypothetical protein
MVMTSESSPKRRSLDWQALIDEALTAPGSLSDQFNRFYNYSYLNTALLMLQGVREPVASYQRWKTMGRQVLKGSKGYEIVRPITVTKKNDEGEVESTFHTFKFVTGAFTYSQTEGEELPPAEVPNWNLDRALERLDIKRVPFSLLDGNVAGISTGREIAINPVDPHPLMTTAHEVGHILLGHTEPPKLAEYREHRGLYEFQAEAVAYLSLHELDKITDEEASESRGYIQHYMQDQRPPDTAIRAVFGATNKLLKAGRLAVEGGEDA